MRKFLATFFSLGETVQFNQMIALNRKMYFLFSIRSDRCEVKVGVIVCMSVVLFVHCLKAAELNLLAC